MLTDTEKQRLNADTIRSLKEILSNEWYPKSQTLGEFGWNTFLNHGGMDWKHYELNSIQMETIEIYAKDDESAIKGFKSLFHLDDMTDFEICEVVTTHRKIYEM